MLTDDSGNTGIICWNLGKKDRVQSLDGDGALREKTRLFIHYNER